MAFNQKPLLGQQINWAHPLAKGLVGCWTMNEGSGDRIYDLSKYHEGIFNANAGAYPTWAPDGILFDSNGESIKGPNGAFLKSKGTIIFRYSQRVIPAAWYYWVVLDDDYIEFAILGSKPDDTLEFQINGVYVNWTTSAYKTAEEDDFAFVWNADENLKSWYLNGMFQGTSSAAFTWDAAGVAAHNLHIGGRLTGADRYAGGIIHYFYVFDRVLTPFEIAWHHCEPYAMFERIDVWKYYVAVTPEEAVTGFKYNPFTGKLDCYPSGMTLGANDSGGTGYRLLRVPNA